MKLFIVFILCLFVINCFDLCAGQLNHFDLVLVVGRVSSDDARILVDFAEPQLREQNATVFVDVFSSRNNLLVQSHTVSHGEDADQSHILHLVGLQPATSYYINFKFSLNGVGNG
jgi:hypothetical protein